MTVKYTMTHEHRFGTDVFRFTSPIELGEYFGTEGFEEALCEKLGINYEPDREEVLTIAAENDSEVVALTIEQVREITKEADSFKAK